MQLGMIGLGRMGGNIARRLIQNGHDVRGLRRQPRKRRYPRQGEGDARPFPPRTGPGPRPAPRGLGDAAGRRDHRRHDRRSWASCCEAGDIVIDGGNTFYKDDIRRAEKLWRARASHYVDVGTSGGVWGLERGYCMMIGGDKDVGGPARSDLLDAGAGRGRRSPRTPDREGRDPRAEHGYMHAGPVGAGHFVKMVHNGIEYGLMQAYAEGFDILRGTSRATSCRKTNASTSTSPTSPRSGGAAAWSRPGCST